MVFVSNYYFFSFSFVVLQTLPANLCLVTVLQESTTEYVHTLVGILNLNEWVWNLETPNEKMEIKYQFILSGPVNSPTACSSCYIISHNVEHSDQSTNLCHLYMSGLWILYPCPPPSSANKFPKCPRAQWVLTKINLCLCVCVCPLKLTLSVGKRTSGPMSNHTVTHKKTCTHHSLTAHTHTDILKAWVTRAWKHEGTTLCLKLNVPLHKGFVSKSHARPSLVPTFLLRGSSRGLNFDSDLFFLKFLQRGMLHNTWL